MIALRFIMAAVFVLLACILVLALVSLDAVAKKVVPNLHPKPCQPWRETCPTRFET